MHYYQFNIGDYRKDTIHLSRLEHSIYRDLIDWYYLDEKPIPKETQVVSRRLRLVSEEELKALSNVLSDFFSVSDDGYHQERIDQDIADYRAQCEKNRANGSKGGRKKGSKSKEKTQSVSTGLPVGAQSGATDNPNHKPLTNNQLPPIPPRGVDELFGDFWAAYPRKVGKDAAYKKFVARCQDEEALRLMLDAVHQQAASDQWTRDAGKFIPHPATWLNQGRWMDEVEPAGDANAALMQIFARGT